MTALLLSIAPFALDLAAKLVVIAFILVRGRARATSRLTWIIVILAVPLLGGVALYLLVGEARLGRGRSVRHRAIVERIERTETGLVPLVAADIPGEYARIAVLAEAVGNRLPRRGNRLDLLADTGQFVSSLVADIDASRERCHLLYYIFLDDASGRRVAGALAAAARRGVECRLLVDGVGSSDFLHSRTRHAIAKTGVRVVEALPVTAVRALFARLDLRNHRKIAIIDDSIGYLGSHNVADAAFAPKPRFAPWVDATVRMVGPAAYDLQVLFVEDWFLDTDESLEHLLDRQPTLEPDGSAAQVMGTGPSSFNAALHEFIHAAIHDARHDLVLTTPYFVPDEATLTAMRATARSGVATTLVLPARNDSPLVGAASRSLYEALLDDGVKIYEFTHGLLHAKTLTIDRDLALVGSANLDRRSFELNFEASLVVYDGDFASEVRFLQQSYIDRSRPLHGLQWRRRPWPAKLLQNAAGTLGPLL